MKGVLWHRLIASMASTLPDQKIAYNANFYVTHWRRIPRSTVML